jgi:hypothetical protein
MTKRAGRSERKARINGLLKNLSGPEVDEQQKAERFIDQLQATRFKDHSIPTEVEWV